MKRVLLLSFSIVLLFLTSSASDPNEPPRKQVVSVTHKEVKSKIVTGSFDISTYKVDHTKKIIVGWEWSRVCSNNSAAEADNCMQQSITECQKQYFVDEISAWVYPETNSQGQPTGKWCYQYLYYYTGN